MKNSTYIYIFTSILTGGLSIYFRHLDNKATLAWGTLLYAIIGVAAGLGIAWAYMKIFGTPKFPRA